MSVAASLPGSMPPLPAAPISVRGPALIGFTVIALAFGGFGGWAAMAPLNSAVVASGAVVVETNRHDLQHLDGGIIHEILVRDGSRVAAGDVLMRLDPTRATSALAVLKNQIDAMSVLVSRLRAEQIGRPVIELDPGITQRAVTDAGLRDIIDGQKSLFDTRRASLAGQVNILRQRIAQLDQQITGLMAQEKARTRQIALISDELRGVEELLRGGFAPRTRALALQRELARLEGERGEHLATVARTRQAIGEAELQIVQQVRTFQEDVARQMQEAQTRLAELQERSVGAQDVVNRLELRAPTDGVVVGMTANTVGGVVAPGRTLLQIVPENDALTVDVSVQVQDIESVQLDQIATLRFSALPQRDLPTLTGTVRQISADRLLDERTGAPYYKVRVMLDEDSAGALHAYRLLPGMPAEAIIQTRARTALRYFMDPVLHAVGRSMRER
ncbi:HlyD family type I secretion periplasmic adaptor subunit [Roseomonas marmotae]|uniref:Membrane fusion protein (MFP) family protein n=1 Tax=Roseomonas marmotae TaxID=2768161 RepID=A0ABS3KHC9_9PROT|nr:HlyD family type I secretion periplasmic adaptor subunit [Roseomonas marmotae]MBO1076886.1 HlyD family type I secretion periplasmic adaptor subunit [Roseomonas marmotae]QTI81136.1 HlyD family type I secretion periplasmic adaptor subunit [Roseomonas marmotae]